MDALWSSRIKGAFLLFGHSFPAPDIPNSQLPTLNSQLSTLNSQLPTLNSQLPTPKKPPDNLPV